VLAHASELGLGAGVGELDGLADARLGTLADAIDLRALQRAELDEVLGATLDRVAAAVLLDLLLAAVRQAGVGDRVTAVSTYGSGDVGQRRGLRRSPFQPIRMRSVEGPERPALREIARVAPTYRLLNLPTRVTRPYSSRGCRLAPNCSMPMT
jgi:hypothetical protein